MGNRLGLGLGLDLGLGLGLGLRVGRIVFGFRFVGRTVDAGLSYFAHGILSSEGARVNDVMDE